MVVAYQVWDIHKLEKDGNRSENPWIIETSAFEDVQKGEAFEKENVLEVFKT